jgi:hypothetical protein
MNNFDKIKLQPDEPENPFKEPVEPEIPVPPDTPIDPYPVIDPIPEPNPEPFPTPPEPIPDYPPDVVF